MKLKLTFDKEADLVFFTLFYFLFMQIAGLELELQKRSALLDSKEKYNKELEYHISLLHQIFLGRFCKK